MVYGIMINYHIDKFKWRFSKKFNRLEGSKGYSKYHDFGGKDSVNKCAILLLLHLSRGAGGNIPLPAEKAKEEWSPGPNLKKEKWP